MRVGLTGGIGSGKSEVARVWAELGALIIDADVAAREAVAPGTQGLAEIAARWPSVVDAQGVLDRAALGRIVFADNGERLALEAIVHPAVRARGEQREAMALPGQVLVHVVPLLFEAGYAEHCDRCVVVVAPDDQRIARVVHRDNLTEAEVRSRMSRQISVAEARKRATDIIENDADLATLRDKARMVYERLTAAGDS